MTESYNFSECKLCPRRCGADRIKGKGLCGVGQHLKIARAALHFWEEPCISGTKGSGTIFFSGCPLRCVFCQNREINSGKGKEISTQRLREICFELKAKGANNINLVTPAHFAPQIRESLLPIKKDLSLPIVVNTGGYDTPEQLRFFDGLADIYLPDFKFGTPEEGVEFAHVSDYTSVAEIALLEMYRQVGNPVFDRNGMLQKGMLVRHLILPSRRKESLAVLERLGELFRKEEILLSIMSQFSPLPGAKPPLHRRITTFEQQSVASFAEKLGFEGYFQERSSASEEYLPPFDLSGV